ncbi:MAG: ribose-phosphate pyrophosphokinae, partial [Actinomycetota bacterium]|nr:ribose-phosphate pyrophosphokinae [Actinomycetota bacterium]
ALVDERDVRAEAVGEAAGELAATRVGGDDHRVTRHVVPQVLRDHGNRREVVDRVVEEALDLTGVQVDGDDAVIVAPDAGGGKLARRFADRLNADIAFIDKRRPKGTHNVAVATEVVGDIDGRTCIIVDDMIDTAGTVVSAANLLIDRGAVEVYIAATHGLLSGPAVDRLKNGPIREVVVTNTVPISDDKRFDNLRVLSIAPLLAEAIDAVFEDGSVSELFGGDNM